MSLLVVIILSIVCGVITIGIFIAAVLLFERGDRR